ncbi:MULTISPECIES: calcium-binding protein [Aerosakkonema]|uniref:calcium-binding protein n=1 Tax=Aerosakkonema TaxID=1246629 RepID=UPI0035BB67C1
MTLSVKDIFDEAYYSKKYKKEIDKAKKEGKVKDAKEHYEKIGKKEDFNPCEAIDVTKYREQNKDVDEAIKTGTLGDATTIDHLLKFGDKEGRGLGTDYFNVKGYAEANPDVKDAASKGKIGYLEHAIKYGEKDGRSLGAGFDAKFYGKKDDVKKAIDKGDVSSSFQYYITKGASAGEIPNPYFDKEEYLKQNKDVADEVAKGTITNVFQHWNAYGTKENRAFNPLIDINLYLEQNKDVGEAVKSGEFTVYQHLVEFGLKEERTFSKKFDFKLYKELNEGVQDSLDKGKYTNAFEEYLLEGKDKGYIASPDFDGATDKEGLLKIALEGSGKGSGNKQIIIASDDEDALLQVEDGKGAGVLIGGKGDNLMIGGKEDDVLIAGQGSAYLIAGVGNDVLYGGSADAYLFGADGNDVLIGGSKSTVLYAGTGKDTLVGGTGKDTFVITNSPKEGTGTDTMSGGGGTDTMSGGNGTDTLTGGSYTIYNFDVKKDKLCVADFGYGDAEEVLDDILKSGKSSSGTYFTVFEFSKEYKITLFGNGELTADNITVGTNGLPSTKLSSKIETGDYEAIGKIKGLPPGLAMQIDKGMKSADELPSPFSGSGSDVISGGGMMAGMM